MEFDDVVEAQQTDDYCVEMSTGVERGTAKAFFRNEHHALYRRMPDGNQLVIPKSLRDRVLTLEHHATVAAHPGMNRMYYNMRKALLVFAGNGHPRHHHQVHNSCSKPPRLAATHHAPDAVPGYGAPHGTVG